MCQLLSAEESEVSLSQIWSGSVNWFQTDSMDRKHVWADGRHFESLYDSLRKLLWQLKSDSGGHLADILFVQGTRHLFYYAHVQKSLDKVNSWRLLRSKEKRDYNNLYFFLTSPFLQTLPLALGGSFIRFWPGSRHHFALYKQFLFSFQQRDVFFIYLYSKFINRRLPLSPAFIKCNEARR